MATPIELDKTKLRAGNDHGIALMDSIDELNRAEQSVDVAAQSDVLHQLLETRASLTHTIIRLVRPAV